MAKFRKKPVVIDAIQYTGENSEDVFKFAKGIDEIYQSRDAKGNYLGIKTLEGVMVGNIGDWIIKGINGEFYPCKPDIFEKTYEPI